MILSKTFAAAVGILGILLFTEILPVFADEGAIPPPPSDWSAVTPTTWVIPKTPYVYKVPKKLSDGWEVGDLRDEKVDLDKISKGVDLFRMRALPDAHSLLVVRHGKILLEEYFDRKGPQDEDQMHSCVKSVFSTVYGIAQDQGLLHLDDKIYGFYPEECSKVGWDHKKDAITVGMLLSMTTGLDGDDEVTGTDWFSFCFGLPLAHPPGTVWRYNGTCLTILTDQIAKKSGMSYPEYADKYLLEPLGIKSKQWLIDPKGYVRVDDGLAWKPRDMAKLGQLYLNKGLWNGQRIVSEAWVKEATTVHAPPGKAWGHDYGYLWHIKTMHWKGRPLQVFYAVGYHGQQIFVSPDADLVCVITAENFSESSAPWDKFHLAEEDFFENVVLGSFDRPDATPGQTADLSETETSNPTPETAPASVVATAATQPAGTSSSAYSNSIPPPPPQPTPDIGEGLPVYDLNAADVDSAGGPYQDSIGTQFRYTLVTNPRRKGSKYFKIDYDMIADGFCGFWFRTGSNSIGQDWTTGKKISFMVYSKHPLTLVLALEDRNHNQYVANAVPTKGTGWERLIVPLDSFKLFLWYAPPGAIKGAPEDLNTVYHLNFAPQTVGKGSFALASVFLVK